MCKISDKSDKFLFNYSSLFWGPLFTGHSEEQVALYFVDSYFCTIYLQKLVLELPVLLQNKVFFSLLLCLFICWQVYSKKFWIHLRVATLEQ